MWAYSSMPVTRTVLITKSIYSFLLSFQVSIGKGLNIPGLLIIKIAMTQTGQENDLDKQNSVQMEFVL